MAPPHAQNSTPSPRRILVKLSKNNSYWNFSKTDLIKAALTVHIRDFPYIDTAKIDRELRILIQTIFEDSAVIIFDIHYHSYDYLTAHLSTEND